MKKKKKKKRCVKCKLLNSSTQHKCQWHTRRQADILLSSISIPLLLLLPFPRLKLNTLQHSTTTLPLNDETILEATPNLRNKDLNLLSWLKLKLMLGPSGSATASWTFFTSVDPSLLLLPPPGFSALTPLCLRKWMNICFLQFCLLAMLLLSLNSNGFRLLCTVMCLNVWFFLLEMVLLSLNSNGFRLLCTLCVWMYDFSWILLIGKCFLLSLDSIGFWLLCTLCIWMYGLSWILLIGNAFT